MQQDTNLTSLDGTRWHLTSFSTTEGPLPIPEGPVAYLEFEDDQLGFSVGCNTVVGDYSADSNRLKITFVAHQLVDCEGSVGGDAMNLEKAFANSLPTWSTYNIENDKLHIGFDDGEAHFDRDISSGTPTVLP